jgi:hypothetical protein
MRIGKLEIEVPEEWEDASLYTFVAPTDDLWATPGKGGSFRTNVVFQSRKVGPNEPLARCVERLMEGTQELFGAVKIEVCDGPQVAGVPSRRLVYSVSDEAGQPVSQVIYLFVVQGLEWQAAFSLAAADKERWLPHFDQMVASTRRV